LGTEVVVSIEMVKRSKFEEEGKENCDSDEEKGK